MSKSITAVRPVVINVNDKTGIITEQQITLPAFMKAVDRKSVDVIAGLKSVLPEGIQTSDRVTFRMFHSGIDTAIAGIGGRVTFASFVQSLSALVTASAYGQNLSAHFDRLPPFAEYSLKLAQGYAGKTESLSLEKLGEIMRKTLSELFALPVASPKKAEKSPVLNIAHKEALPEKSEDDVTRDENGRVTESAAEKAARETAERKAAFEAETVARVTNMPDEQAIFLIRAMAARYGFTLASIKKSLDEQYNDEILAIQAEVAEEKAKKAA